MVTDHRITDDKILQIKTNTEINFRVKSINYDIETINNANIQ